MRTCSQGFLQQNTAPRRCIVRGSPPVVPQADLAAPFQMNRAGLLWQRRPRWLLHVPRAAELLCRNCCNQTSANAPPCPAAQVTPKKWGCPANEKGVGAVAAGRCHLHVPVGPQLSGLTPPRPAKSRSATGRFLSDGGCAAATASFHGPLCCWWLCCATPGACPAPGLQHAAVAAPPCGTCAQPHSSSRSDGP